MKICVLAGGLSPERDVSLSSGALIANALVKNGHEVALVDLFWGVEDISSLKWTREGLFSYTIPESEPDLNALIEKAGRASEIGDNVIEICKSADVAFLALHGGIGENGQLQAELDRAGVRYTGSPSVGCMQAMDKDISKVLVHDAGIPTAKWIRYEVKNADCDEIIEKIGLPCVVKPLSCGSSVGVSIVNDREQLCSALTLAEKYESSILVESFVHGREFSVGILGDKALPPIEIIPKSGFYDYKNKYQSGMTEEICPAELTTEQDRILREYALRSHHCLGLGSYSRIDFILDSESGDFVFLEANALPGMTPTSLLPQEARADGIEYGQLCEIIAESAKKESVSH